MDLAVTVAGAESSTPQAQELLSTQNTSTSVPSGTGGLQETSESGLPELPGIQWEWKKDGGVECWLLPFPNATRRERVYLKRAGKRLLTEWQQLPRDERDGTIRQWVSLARMSKVQQKQNHREKRNNL